LGRCQVDAAPFLQAHDALDERAEDGQRQIFLSDDSAAAQGQSSASSTMMISTSMQLFAAFRERSGCPVDMALASITSLTQREHIMLHPEELQLFPHEVLGRGAFGVVAPGLLCGAPVAVKLPHLDSAGNGIRKRLPALGNELHVMRHLHHPNIVKLYGVVVDPGGAGMGLVLELLKGCDLKDFMVQPQFPSVPHQYQIMLGITRALWYLHSRKPAIVHGDVKCSNIMIETHGTAICAKLLDFGLARLLAVGARPLWGSLATMAPEVFQRRDRPPACSADVFSFGRTAVFLFTGLRPLADMSQTEVRQCLRTAAFPPLEWTGRSPLEPLARPLVETFLCVQERRRPSMASVHQSVEGWRFCGVLPPDEFGADSVYVGRRSPDGPCDWKEGLAALDPPPAALARRISRRDRQRGSRPSRQRSQRHDSASSVPPSRAPSLAVAGDAEGDSSRKELSQLESTGEARQHEMTEETGTVSTFQSEPPSGRQSLQLVQSTEDTEMGCTRGDIPSRTSERSRVSL